jgi:hypothetical protein
LEKPLIYFIVNPRKINMLLNIFAQALLESVGRVGVRFAAKYSRRPGGRREVCLALADAMVVASALYFACPSLVNSTPLPPDANVLDVKRFGAKGDGATDDTRAIQTAIDQLPPFDVNHPWQTRIIYFPTGTYLIRDTLQRKDNTGRYLPDLVMIGQSQKDTIIKLADNSPGFQDKSNGRSMILMASGLLGGDPRAGGKDPALGEGNDAYMNALENLTLEVGKGNVGAIGLDYLANNIGAVRDVTIRADDHARIGLSMTRKWIGPALIERVSIIGFDIGIDISRTEYSVTLDDVTVQKSREFGLRNNLNSVPFHNLTIDIEAGVGIANIGQQALITGIKGDISGRGEAAFQNSGSANLQSVTTSHFLQNPSGKKSENLDGVFEGEKRIADSRWNLPILSSSVPDEPSSHDWVSVQTFGAIADPRVDSTRAINAAFHSGAKTIYFPTGQYKISGSIAVPVAVEKIEGLFSTIFADPNSKGLYPVFFTEPRATAVALRRLIVESRNGPYAIFEHRASSSVLLQDIVGNGVGLITRPSEGGNVFAENISCSGREKLSGPAGAWFRQLNVEANGTLIETDGTPLWILGAKTEQTLTLVNARNHANTEVIGGLIYRVKPESTDVPLFVSESSRLVASYAEEAFFPTAVYSVHLLSKSGGQETAVKASDLPLRGKFGRMVQQLYMGN